MVKPSYRLVFSHDLSSITFHEQVTSQPNLLVGDDNGDSVNCQTSFLCYNLINFPQLLPGAKTLDLFSNSIPVVCYKSFTPSGSHWRHLVSLYEQSLKNLLCNCSYFPHDAAGVRRTQGSQAVSHASMARTKPAYYRWVKICLTRCSRSEISCSGFWFWSLFYLLTCYSNCWSNRITGVGHLLHLLFTGEEVG